MKIFRRCFWCDKHSLELDYIEYLLKTMDENENLPKYKKKDASMGYMIEKGGMTCGFCGNILLPSFKDFPEIIKYAYELYEEFVEFMDGAPMPKDIIIKWDGEPSYSGLCDYDERLKKFVVRFSSNFMIEIPRLKSLLFHEFAHIFDKYDPISNGKRIETETKHEHWYTEYYATEIELMADLGFNTVNENRQVRLSQNLIRENKAITLKEYLINSLTNMSKGITKICEKDVKTYEDIILLTKNLMYYRGKVNFCRKYLRDVDLVELPISGNELELLVKEKLADKNKLFDELLNMLDAHLFNSFNNVNGTLIDDIMLEILLFLTFNNVKEYKRLKIEHNTRLKLKLNEMIKETNYNENK